jgi:hypothetical protein
VRKAAIWCSREADITVGVRESHDNASGVVKLGTEDDESLIQLLRESEGAASKDGVVR